MHNALSSNTTFFECLVMIFLSYELVGLLPKPVGTTLLKRTILTGTIAVIKQTL